MGSVGKFRRIFPQAAQAEKKREKVKLTKFWEEIGREGGVFNVVWPLPREEGEMSQSG